MSQDIVQLMGHHMASSCDAAWVCLLSGGCACLLRRGEPSVKCASLNLMAAAVEGLGNNDRNVVAVHAEALKTADKYAKDKYSDNALRHALPSMNRHRDANTCDVPNT